MLLISVNLYLLADVLVNDFGIVNAINLDGGKSTLGCAHPECPIALLFGRVVAVVAAAAAVAIVVVSVVIK
jgi:hypothetical protein